MIQINYRPTFYSLEVTGHAMAGEKGEDLVCAGVSALVNTLAINCNELSVQGVLTDLKCELEEGKTFIRAYPRARSKSIVQLVFDTIAMGLASMASAYPDNIDWQRYA